MAVGKVFWSLVVFEEILYHLDLAIGKLECLQDGAAGLPLSKRSPKDQGGSYKAFPHVIPEVRHCHFFPVFFVFPCLEASDVNAATLRKRIQFQLLKGEVSKNLWIYIFNYQGRGIFSVCFFTVNSSSLFSFTNHIYFFFEKLT